MTKSENSAASASAKSSVAEKTAKPKRKAVKKMGKVVQQIAVNLAAGGYIKVEVGTRVSESRRGMSMRAYEERSLYSPDKKFVRKLTEFQVQQAAQFRLVDLKEFEAIPRPNCFDTSKRTARLFGVKDALETAKAVNE